jgi:3-oxoacyl-[acyl-carrier-protein] synthase II
VTDRVVISGIGVVCPLGNTLEEFWSNCLRGTAVVQPIPGAWHRYASYQSVLWAPLPLLALGDRGVTRVERLQSDRFTLFAMVAADEALRQALLTPEVVDRRHNRQVLPGVDHDRAGVFLGTGAGGAETLLRNHTHHLLAKPVAALHNRAPAKDAQSYNQVLELLDHPPRLNPLAVSMLIPNAGAASLGIRYSLAGQNSTICASCSSGTIAIGQAYRQIADGKLDVALAGGSEALNDPHGALFRGFDGAGTLVRDCDPPEKANRPFDRSRSGFLFSEGGSTILVLERLDHARERGAPILAEIIGFEESFDAHSMMAIQDTGAQITAMLRNLLQQAKLRPEDVDYLNAHGTGTQLNDEVETGIIGDVFGKDVLVNSTKSLVGHMIGASGALEAAVAALSVREGRTHACSNLDEPIRDLSFVREGTPVDREIRVAISQSFGFGGHNASLALRRCS